MEPKEEKNQDLGAFPKISEQRIRKLEAEKQILEAEKILLERNLRTIRSELDRMKKTPLITAVVVDILEDGNVIVQSSTGPRFIVQAPKDIPKEDLKPRVNVALNQRNFSIIKVLEQDKIEEIEVHNTGEKKTIQFKNLKDFYKVIRTYEIPFVYKSDNEYITFSIYSDFIFRYKLEK